ncbi:hypothetical protein E5D57_007086 [Metarhizium anisopliae]|nr:hypothetical protein E5D57_007086 [Metarhizium anisopliae]
MTTPMLSIFQIAIAPSPSVARSCHPAPLCISTLYLKEASEGQYPCMKVRDASALFHGISLSNIVDVEIFESTSAIV